MGIPGWVHGTRTRAIHAAGPTGLRDLMDRSVGHLVPGICSLSHMGRLRAACWLQTATAMRLWRMPIHCSSASIATTTTCTNR